VDVLEFGSLPWRGAVSLLTAGVSETIGPPCGVELLFAFNKKHQAPDAVKLLAAAAEFVLNAVAQRGSSLHGGEVLGPAGPLVPGSSLEAFVTCDPVFHPPQLRECGTERGPIRVWWLLPISRGEAAFIEKRGVVDFLKAVESQDPEVLNLMRAPLDLTT